MLSNMKNKMPDLTTGGQKAFAAIALIATGIGMYYLLPPIVTIMKNLWIAAILGVPMLFAAFNYEIIWDWFKQLSWKMTKKYISTDPLWHMYRYRDYMLSKIEGLFGAIKEITASKEKSERRILELKKEISEFEHQIEFNSDKPVLVNVLYAKVKTNQDMINTLEPRLTFIESQLEQLKEVHNLWVADTEVLTHELDGKSQEYQMLKEISGASDKASVFLGDNSQEMKLFKESLAQIEDSVAKYTANITTIETKLMPKMLQSQSKFEYNASEGQKIIEQLKAERLELKK